MASIRCPHVSNFDGPSLPLYQNGSTVNNKPRLFRRNTWYKFLSHCLLFFLLGFLLGIQPFDHIYTLGRHLHDDFFFRRQQHTQSNHIVLPSENKNTSEIPQKLLIVITPTYNRVLQAYSLNRVGQVLRLVRPQLLWIVVEMGAQSGETAKILREGGVMYRHLVCHKNSTEVKDRGVHQRNVALEHIERHRPDGVIYFADDDNIYTVELFERIREISRFGTWPVAMMIQGKNKAILEGPICNGSQVIRWHTNEKSKRLRRFHVDMSGFAFNSTILWDPGRWKHPFEIQ